MSITDPLVIEKPTQQSPIICALIEQQRRLDKLAEAIKSLGEQLAPIMTVDKEPEADKTKAIVGGDCKIEQHINKATQDILDFMIMVGDLQNRLRL